MKNLVKELEVGSGKSNIIPSECHTI